MVESELGGLSTVFDAGVPPRDSGALGRQAPTIQQLFGFQISAAHGIDEAVPVPVEEEQLALGAGRDESSVQVPALSP